jgi:hypothetical protein
VDHRERRRPWAPLDAETVGDALNERGLARPELTDEQQDLAGLQQIPDAASEGCGLVGRLRANGEEGQPHGLPAYGVVETGVGSSGL